MTTNMNKSPTTDALDAELKPEQARQQTDLKTTLELSAAMKEIERLKDTLRAAWRLRYYGYYEWSKASGLENCHHGICKGIECARCDELKLREIHSTIYP